MCYSQGLLGLGIIRIGKRSNKNVYDFLDKNKEELIVAENSGQGPRLSLWKDLVKTHGLPCWVKTPRVDNDINDIFTRVFNRLGEQEYALLENNCEHFATYCITGVAESYQAKTLEKFCITQENLNKAMER